MTTTDGQAPAGRAAGLHRLTDEFVAMTSHELRGPLTVIRGFARTLLLRDLELDASERHRLVAIVDRQAERLTRLVEDLLTVSRLDAGRFDLRTAEHDPARLLSEYAEEWAGGPTPVALELAGDLPLVRTDPDRLAQVVRNLVDNAVRHGRGSPVCVVGRADGGDLVVEVRDQGPGIPAADLPHVFEPFRQAGPPTADRVGAGLGLHVTRQLLAAMGGTVEVQSRAGEGATFTVRLPGVPAAPAT
jgi:signal transduction histidine kinase